MDAMRCCGRRRMRCDVNVCGLLLCCAAAERAVAFAAVILVVAVGVAGDVLCAALALCLRVGMICVLVACCCCCTASSNCCDCMYSALSWVGKPTRCNHTHAPSQGDVAQTHTNTQTTRVHLGHQHTCTHTSMHLCRH